MQSKESKKSKINNNQNINTSSNNKHIDENILINKLIQKNKNSKTIPKNNSNSNITRVKTQESKTNTSNFNPNKLSKNNTNIEKEKKPKNIHTPISNHEKIYNDNKVTKSTISTKQKTPNKINHTEKSKKAKITKKHTLANESKKNPFLRSKTNYDNLNNNININNINDKRKKSDNVNNRAKNEGKQKNNKLEEKENEFNTQKLLEFLISLSPIDTSKCDDLISNNMSKIIDLENQIKDISKTTQYEILKLTSDENNKNNKITTKQNLEIINKESNMRKDIYKLFFNFITDLLEQINKLSNNIARQEISDLNLRDNTSSSNDGLFLNNNISDFSNNSLFISNIEEEFCERLINITRSFISSDIDLNDLKSNFDGEDKKFEKDDMFKEDEKIIDNNNNNEYNSIAKTKYKNIFMVHPNEILDKIENEKKKDKKVIHHYSNSLKVNSNLEKLESKVNNDEDTMKNNDTIGNVGNLEKLKNCNIF
jgi:hypothetical protein